MIEDNGASGVEHPGPWSAFAAAYVTTKPEPAEDHLRRACEELGRDYRSYVLGIGIGANEISVRTVARLLAERDAMQAEIEAWKVAAQAWQDNAQAAMQPDPDLVLAREEVKQWMLSHPDATKHVTREALLDLVERFRALKLKGQAHDQ